MIKLDIIMSIKYGEPLLFKPQNVCKRSGRTKVLSITNKVEDGCRSACSVYSANSVVAIPDSIVPPVYWPLCTFCYRASQYRIRSPQII